MLKIADRALPKAAADTLTQLQAAIDEEAEYAAKVEIAKSAWASKTSTSAKASAFTAVRNTLSKMCVGSVRCAYCEDSLADEIEHIRPKNFFPDAVFSWSNYLFACGPCNGPKSNRHGIVAGNVVQEIFRRRGDPVVPPPAGLSALINPRVDDPLAFFELDLGGVTPEGTEILGTMEFLAAEHLNPSAKARAEFTIDVLGLNREVIRVARANAFGGFRARLSEYVSAKEAGANSDRLEFLKADLLRTPHLTVFAEMRRQSAHLPDIHDFFERAPEALTWPVVVPDQ